MPRCGRSQHLQHPGQTRGTPNETQHRSGSFAPGCQSLTAARLYVPLQLLPLSHPCALHTTYRLMQIYVTAHPSGLVTLSSRHTPPHNTNPSMGSRKSTRLRKSGLGSSSPHPRHGGSAQTIFAGDDRVKFRNRLTPTTFPRLF